MLVSQFDFELPKSSIAQVPVSPRDSAKLLVVGDERLDRHIYDLPSLLLPGDLLVFNDTKVIPTRFMLTQEGRTIEATLIKRVSDNTWQAFVKPARKLHIGKKAIIAEGFYAEVLSKQDGKVELLFNVSGDALVQAFYDYGVMPLPPYIKRKITDTDSYHQDRQDYQTMFAQEEGAVAAPTAGLHFTPALLDGLRQKGIDHVTVTLHVGAGTFLPVKVDDTKDHVMHKEYGHIKAEVAEKINATKQQGGRIVAVGTTSLRLLETAATAEGSVLPYAEETGIFITPGYRFKLVDILLTNFHLPKSTLFMLVSAFSGLERMKQAYIHAIDRQYRFYSYGDACLLLRDDGEK